MITQGIELKDYGWRVMVFYAVTRYDIDTVMEALHGIGCDGKFAKQAWRNMSGDKANTGLTYTNYLRKCSVVMIGLTTSAEEFINSFVHETHHLVAHIGKAVGLDVMGEDICYLHGELAREMFRACHKLLCDECREELDGLV